MGKSRVEWESRVYAARFAPVTMWTLSVDGGGGGCVRRRDDLALAHGEAAVVIRCTDLDGASGLLQAVRVAVIAGL